MQELNLFSRSRGQERDLHFPDGLLLRFLMDYKDPIECEELVDQEADIHIYHWVAESMLRCLVEAVQGFHGFNHTTLADWAEEDPTVRKLLDKMLVGLDSATVDKVLHYQGAAPLSENRKYCFDWLREASGQQESTLFELDKALHIFLLNTCEEYDMRHVFRLEALELYSLTENSFCYNALQIKQDIEDAGRVILLPGDKDYSTYVFLADRYNFYESSPFGSCVPVYHSSITEEDARGLKVLPVAREFFDSIREEFQIEDTPMNVFAAACKLYSVINLNTVVMSDEEEAKYSNLFDKSAAFFDPYARMFIWEQLLPKEALESVVFKKAFMSKKSSTAFPAIYRFCGPGVSKVYDTQWVPSTEKVAATGYKVLVRAANFVNEHFDEQYRDSQRAYRGYEDCFLNHWAHGLEA